MITSGYTPLVRNAKDLHAARQQQPPKQPTQQLQQPPKQPTQMQQPIQQQQAIQAPQQAKQQQEKQEKKTYQFHMRMTNKQRMKLKKLKKTWGLATDAAVVSKLIDSCSEAEKPTSDTIASVQELTQIRKELNKIGINVNQIAKAANQSALTHQDAVYIAQAAMMIKKVVYGGE